MARQIGVKETRRFLGHPAESLTLEKYYLNMTETLDAMGVLTNQVIESSGHSTSLVWSPLAMDKLATESMQRSRGYALDQMT